MEWPATPLLAKGNHPLGRSGVDEPPQSALGVVRPLPKGLKTKQNKKVRGLEGGQTTPKGLEVVSTTPYDRYGGGLRPLGVIRPPPKPKPFFLFLVSRPFRGGWTTPRAWGWFRPPHITDLAKGLWG
jgi:hypothetical protein